LNSKIFSIGPKDKRKFLRNLAWKMQTGRLGHGGNLISDKELEAAIDAAFADRIHDKRLRDTATGLVIEQLVKRNYIICYAGDAKFSFLHRGFLEFFASEYLVEMAKHKGAVDELGKTYRKYARVDNWREVLVLAATGFKAPLADKILSPLVVGADEQAVATAACYKDSEPFLIAARALAAIPEPGKLRDTSASVRKSLEKWITRKSDFIDGDGWINLLIRIFPDEDTHALLTKVALRNEMTFTRLGAIIGLAETFHDPEKGGEETRALLLELAGRDKHEKNLDVRNPRKLVAAALVKYFGDEGTRVLLTEMGYSEEVAAGPTTLDEYFGPVATRIRLTEFVRSDEDTANRHEAIRALAGRFKRFHEDATLKVLLELARRDENTGARAQAIASLAKHFSDVPNLHAKLLTVARTDTGKQAIGRSTRDFAKGGARGYLKAIQREAKTRSPRR